MTDAKEDPRTPYAGKDSNKPGIDSGMSEKEKDRMFNQMEQFEGPERRDVTGARLRRQPDGDVATLAHDDRDATGDRDGDRQAAEVPHAFDGLVCDPAHQAVGQRHPGEARDVGERGDERAARERCIGGEPG